MTPLQIYFIIEVSLNLNTINTSFVLISNHTNEGPLPYLNACEPVHKIPITWSAVGSPSAASVVNKEYSHAILSNYFTSLYCQVLFTLVYGWLWSSINISQQFLICLHGSGGIRMPSPNIKSLQFLEFYLFFVTQVVSFWDISDQQHQNF